LRSTYLKDTTMQQAKVRVAELELNELLDAAKPDAAKVEKKVREMESLRSELTLSRVRYLLKAADFLTPEQFKKFRAMTMGRHMDQMMGASHGPMKKGGPGMSLKDGSGMAPGTPPHQ
jgi:Spy/CpxP family protein refolding chaperone